MIYFTSDLHIGHNKDFRYKPRGFNSIQEHDESLVANWNNLITDNDEVYILGDLIMGDQDHGADVLNSLKGKKHIIKGNHDTDNKIIRYCAITSIGSIQYATVLQYKKYSFYLSHYPTITAKHNTNKELKARVINLCGHTHTKDKFADWDKGCIYHVELDAHNMTPVSIDQIISDIKEKLVTG